jgi:CheY-like chemotaxis protein
LIDIVMRGMDGLELAGRILERGPRPAVVLMSAFASTRSIRLIDGSDPQPVLRKPFDAAQLACVLDEIWTSGAFADAPPHPDVDTASV